jgi:hypothetical protein
MRSFPTIKHHSSSIFPELMFLIVFGLMVSPAVPACADTTAAGSPSSSDGSGSKLLNGSAEDKERMQQSVKLFLDPPTRPPAPKFQPTPPPPPLVPLSGSVTGQPPLGGTVVGHPPLSGGTSFIPVPLPRPHFVAPLWGTAVPPPFRPPFRPMFVPPAPPRWNYTLTPRNGIMTWSPGYSTAIVPPSHFSSLETNLNWSNKNVNASRIGLQQPPAMPQLKAIEMTLPEAKVPPPANWDEWYERVAHAIYGQWKQQTAVGPGTSTVLITAYRTHDVDCKIEDFTPAADVKRDLNAETRFRDASLRSVSSLSRDPLWEFPVSQKTPKMIVFDMQFKHGVGEAAGCEVVHIHDNKTPSAQQDGSDGKGLSDAAKGEQLAADLGMKVSPGPSEDKRKALLGSIAVAKEKGIGITTYVAAFKALDQSVTSGAAEADITEKVASLQSTLDEQFKRSDIMKTEQLGPPVAGSHWHTRPPNPFMHRGLRARRAGQ